MGERRPPSPTKVYLFAGDSLTEGIYGESYVERVSRALSQGTGRLAGQVLNAGHSGETVRSLLDRLGGLLQQYRPDWVLLAVGGNDVWWPWLGRNSLGWWLWLLHRRFRYGQQPTTDLDRFAAAYRALIDLARGAGAQVLACTISPFGENLASPANRQLARANGAIKQAAAERGVLLADVWQSCVEELAPLPRPSGYVTGEWLFDLLDRQRLRRGRLSPDDISRRRGLHLTFDGIHLNSRGADLWAATILAALARAVG